jgi:hypothetical protein
LKTKSATTTSAVRRSQQATLSPLLPSKGPEILPSCEYGHLAASPTEGEGLAVILHDEPLEAPPLDAILQRDIEVL